MRRVGNPSEGNRVVIMNTLEAIRYALSQSILTHNQNCKKARESNDLADYEVQRMMVDDLQAAQKAMAEEA
jgi:hypothetical protein